MNTRVKWLVILIALFVFLGVSCNQDNVGVQLGSLELVIDSAGMRGLQAISMETASYNVVVRNSEGVVVLDYSNSTRTSYSVSVPVGSYSAEVEALNRAGDVIGSGTATGEVLSGQVNRFTVVVTEIQGIGTISMAITGNAGESLSYVVADATGEEVSSGNLKYASGVYSASVDLQNGFYTLSILNNNTPLAAEAVRVISGRTAVFNADISITGEGLLIIKNGIVKTPTITVSLNKTFFYQTDTLIASAKIDDLAGHDFYWMMDGEERKRSDSYEGFELILEDMTSGEHNITLVVSDGSVIWSGSRTFTIREGLGNGEPEYYTDFKTNSVYAGSMTTVLDSQSGGGVSHDYYTGVSGKDYTDPAFYTFNNYTTSISGMKWSTHTWETSSDSDIVTLISSGFYGFSLNNTLDGWAITCEMASEFPVDVTSEYVGLYGIKEGETAKAWKVTLNSAACWEDGTPINADTYIYSYKELLDPLMKNRRADSLYAGDFVIYNARAYFYAGQSVYQENATGAYYAMKDLTVGEDGQYYTPDGEPVFLAVDYPLANWLSGNSLAAYVNAYGAAYFGMDTWEELAALADADGLVPLTDATYALYAPVTTANPAWGETEADLPAYFVYQQIFPALDWSEVGILKTDDYELVFITASPIGDADYNVPYNLSNTYLVYEPLWEACKTYYNSNGNKVSKDNADVASISTTYCTTADTTMSYGPYKLTSYEPDKQYILERNETWYGYEDGLHLGQYQTDRISVQVIYQHKNALVAYQSGSIDSVSLQTEDMDTFGSSGYIRYTPQSYTTKLTFNIDPISSASRGTQVLTNANFRKGFSLAIDVNTFASSLTTGEPGYGLLNTLYVSDRFTGLSYRSTDGAKKAIVELYGLTYGEGGAYYDLDEAYDAVTGYDLAGAREAMALAYEETKAAGIYNDEKVELEIRVYRTDDIYVKMVNFLKDALESACAGTGFEGKVSLKMTEDANYYDTMYRGETDIIFTTWGGAAESPYTILSQCYCDASDGSGNQMEYGFDTSEVQVTIIVDGIEFTESLQTWAKWACGDYGLVITAKDGSRLAAFNDYDTQTKAEFYGKLEYAYLSFYATTPLYYRSVASMISQKGDYAVSDYVDRVGFGGIKYYTYDYDDIAWSAYMTDVLYN